MANLSSAYGTLTIRKDVWDGIADTFEEYFKNYKVPCYGVSYWDEPDFDEDSVNIDFCGNGRWAFASCAEDAEWFFFTEENPLGKEILDYLAKCGDNAIEIEFSDEEGGCEVLYTERITSIVVDGRVLMEVIGEDTYEYTSRNLVELGFYDDHYDGYEDVVNTVSECIKFPLSDEAKAYIKEELRDSRHDGVLVEWEMDVLISTIESEYAPKEEVAETMDGSNQMVLSAS